MDMDKVKMIGGGVVGAIVIAAGAFYYGTSSAQPELVAITNVGCGSPAGSGRFEVPLQTVSLAAPTMMVSYSDLDLPSANKKLRLSFDRNVDGKGDEVLLIGDTLHLPLTFGRNDAAPTSIRINCREGSISGIRYQRDRANATYNVVRQTVSEAVEDVVQPETTEG